jgi:RNA polymerase-binding protein DksA
MKKNKQRDAKNREMLVRSRDEIYERVKAFRRDQSEERLSTPGDPMDVAKSSVDVETHASIIDRLERQLAQIDDALAAVDAGTYGICRNCGREIAFERLKAIPSAIYCVDCQAEMSPRGSGTADRETLSRWTPPPEADENKLLSDRDGNSLDELALRKRLSSPEETTSASVAESETPKSKSRGGERRKRST